MSLSINGYSSLLLPGRVQGQLFATLQAVTRSRMQTVRRQAPAAFALTFLLAACQSGPQAALPSTQQVADAFVTKVVLPDYAQLAEQSQHLALTLDALAADPDAVRLEKARRAWQQVRATWERGESWAFGPAETGGFDGNLDAWPVNEKDLKAALASGALTPGLFAKLSSTAKGFHGIEAVLYGTNAPRPQANKLRASELSYLQQAGSDLAANAKGLLAAWRGSNGFGAEFKVNGDEAVSEILQGMVGTLEEVAAEKLGAPLKSRAKADLESFYSDNTSADIAANLAGIQMSLKRSGLIAWIKGRDAKLAKSLETALDQVQTSAQALPSGLNDKLDDAAGRERIQAVISGSDRTVALLKQAAALLS
ncbi:imelysin family protein [Vulcanococcus limneticus]|uniref:imelysin family protein n=1 Tax=Vulcanococcus limneticus TaxID=2170428 RepID=UPI00398C03B8